MARNYAAALNSSKVSPITEPQVAGIRSAPGRDHRLPGVLSRALNRFPKGGPNGVVPLSTTLDLEAEIRKNCRMQVIFGTWGQPASI